MLTVSHLVNCFLLLVRSHDDIPRACREAGEFLAFQRARLPTMHAEQDRRPIGIWVDAVMVDVPPQVFDCASASGRRPFQIRETVGLGGIRQLCWLDVASDGRQDTLAEVREALVSALLGERPRSTDRADQRFIPVFDADDTLAFIQPQIKRLQELFPDLIGPPAMWNRTTAILAT
jgi:hypothetical protein